MKVLDWSLAQEMIHQRDNNVFGKKPFGQDWTKHSYYCKKCGQLVPKGTELHSQGNHRPMCPIHHQLLRHHKHRTKYTVDNRRRVDC